MILLSIDTCDARGSVALLRDGKALQVIAHDTPEEYSAWLLPTVGKILTANSLSMTDVDAYVVAAGPGSFTGVRVGLTTVKAWGEVHGRPIVSVSRLEAIASLGNQDLPFVAAFVDGSRGQIFGALYGMRDTELHLIGEERVMDPQDFLEFVDDRVGKAEVCWVSSDPEKLQQTPLWRSAEKAHGQINGIAPLLAGTIGMIGYQKARNLQFVDALDLDANYVRRPDAEVFWKGRSATPTKQP